MRDSGSVSAWLESLKAGDESAARQLWDRYFRPLVAHARTRLAPACRALADEEDVALCAFDALCRGAAADRFPYLYDRENLWRLLLTLVAQKAIDLGRHEQRAKRYGGPRTDISADELSGPEPAPDFLAQMTEECDHLFGRLRTEELRSIARWRLEGYTVEEIAERLGCVGRTVERKLEVIRRLWRARAAP